jgi:hypothetical protein
MSRAATEEYTAVELSRDEWLALLAAASYGLDVVEREIGGKVAGIGKQALVYILADLDIHSLTAEAREREINL